MHNTLAGTHYCSLNYLPVALKKLFLLIVTGSPPLHSTTVATAGWPLVSAMNAAMSCLPAAGHGWKAVTPLMGTFLATAKAAYHFHRTHLWSRSPALTQL